MLCIQFRHIVQKYPSHFKRQEPIQGVQSLSAKNTPNCDKNSVTSHSVNTNTHEIRHVV